MGQPNTGRRFCGHQLRCRRPQWSRQKAWFLPAARCRCRRASRRACLSEGVWQTLQSP